MKIYEDEGHETMKAMKAAKPQTMKDMMKAAKPKSMKAMKDMKAAKPKSMKAMEAMQAGKPKSMKATKLNVVNTSCWSEEAKYLWRAIDLHHGRIECLETAERESRLASERAMMLSTGQQNVACKDVD